MSKRYKESNRGMTAIMGQVFFSKFSTKHPERLIKDVKDAKHIQGINFSIDVRIVETGKVKKT